MTKHRAAAALLIAIVGDCRRGGVPRARRGRTTTCWQEEAARLAAAAGDPGAAGRARRGRRSRRGRRPARAGGRRSAAAPARARIRWSRPRPPGCWRGSTDERGETREAQALRAPLGLLTHVAAIGPFGQGRASFGTALPARAASGRRPERPQLSGQDARRRLALGRCGGAGRRAVPGRSAPSRQNAVAYFAACRAQRSAIDRRHFGSGRPGRSRCGSTARPCSTATWPGRPRSIRTRPACASAAAGTGS